MSVYYIKYVVKSQFIQKDNVIKKGIVVKAFFE